VVDRSCKARRGEKLYCVLCCRKKSGLSMVSNQAAVGGILPVANARAGFCEIVGWEVCRKDGCWVMR